MIKIAIINDLHFGVRDDSLAFQQKHELFTAEFIQYLKAHPTIKHVVIAGDLFDRRKHINFVTLKYCRETLLEPLDQLGVTVHMIPGNHDIYYRNTINVNSLSELVRGYDNFKIYFEPTNLVIGHHNILLVPWICAENEELSLKTIEKSNAPYCIAHLELNGFEMNRGVVATPGLDKKMFGSFDWVGTGHFHKRSSQANIHYLGAMYEFTWADHNDPRGFTILDLDECTHEHINNEHPIYHVYDYNDETGKDDIENKLTQDFSIYENCHIKVKIQAKTNTILFDMLVDKFESANPIKVSIVDETLDFKNEDEMIDEDDIKNTPTLINNYVDGLNMNGKSEKLKGLMNELYETAVSLENVE